MEKLNSIAIVTLYDNMNIGNKLQNYAVQEILKEYSKNVVTLSYSDAKKIAPDMGWKGKIIAFLGLPSKIAGQKRAIKKRRKKFERFSELYLNVESPRSFKEYNSEIEKEYDAFIVGSDQVWHDWSGKKEELDYFFLKFVPFNKRICLSPSFGLESIEETNKLIYVEGLKGFQYLSCREKSGCDVIKKLVGRDAELLIDPTMMLSDEKWNCLAKKPEYAIPSKYVLVYFIGGKSANNKKDVRNISEQMSADIIDVLDLEEIMYYTTSPEEFIYLISNAEFVCTNSFHACVFSILYRKQFKYYDREDCIGSTMSGRQKTLIEKFKLKCESDKYNFSSVDSVLTKERQKMSNYLKKTLNGVFSQDIKI